MLDAKVRHTQMSDPGQLAFEADTLPTELPHMAGTNVLTRKAPKMQIKSPDKILKIFQ